MFSDDNPYCVYLKQATNRICNPTDKEVFNVEVLREWKEVEIEEWDSDQQNSQGSQNVVQ